MKSVTRNIRGVTERLHKGCLGAACGS